jgi:hypothetical protein
MPIFIIGYYKKTSNFITNSLSNYMELSSSWEAASCAASQEFPKML